MAEALLIIAVLCGCVGAWKGSRTAIALVASTALTSILIWAQAPFNIAVWLLIDIGVIVTITSRVLSIADMMILTLFMPAWAFYAVDDPRAADAITVIVSFQLMLSAPWRWASRKLHIRKTAPADEGDFLMVADAGR